MLYSLKNNYVPFLCLVLTKIASYGRSKTSFPSNLKNKTTSVAQKSHIQFWAYHNHINSEIAKKMGQHFVCDMRSTDFTGVDMSIKMRFIAEFSDNYFDL
jgi:hypothetical protein